MLTLDIVSHQGSSQSLTDSDTACNKHMEETDPAERIFLPSAGFSLQETDRWWKKPFSWHGIAQCPDPISALFTLPYGPRSSPSLTFFFYFLSCLALFPVMNSSAEVNIRWIRRLVAREKKQTTNYTQVFSITLNWTEMIFLSAVYALWSWHSALSQLPQYRPFSGHEMQNCWQTSGTKARYRSPFVPWTHMFQSYEQF